MVRLHSHYPSTLACKAHSAPMVAGLALPVATMRCVQVSSQRSSLSSVKLGLSASTTSTRFSKNMSIAAICAAVVAAAPVWAAVAFVMV